MKRFLVLMLFFIVFVMQLSAYIRPFTCPPTEQEWWRTRTGSEKFLWVDHNGHTNTVVRKVADTGDVTTIGSSFRTVTAVFGADHTLKSYTLDSSMLNKDGSYNLDKVAPATYDMINGKWYGDMTVEEKTALWVVYTNKVHLAYLADKAIREAPAKFDVSKTPEEYKKELLGDRKLEDLLPEERLEFFQEFHKYEDEWTRINQPNRWRRIPFLNENLTEQQKKGRNLKTYRQPRIR